MLLLVSTMFKLRLNAHRLILPQTIGRIVNKPPTLRNRHSKRSGGGALLFPADPLPHRLLIRCIVGDDFVPSLWGERTSGAGAYNDAP